jgi:hypothetical protein
MDLSRWDELVFKIPSLLPKDNPNQYSAHHWLALENNIKGLQKGVCY